MQGRHLGGWGGGSTALSFLALVLGGGEWLALLLCRFTPGCFGEEKSLVPTED
jgi:hypothetical protein